MRCVYSPKLEPSGGGTWLTTRLDRVAWPAKVLDLLKRDGGATTKELLKVTGWQPHSLRGFLSGTVGKKMGLTVVSAKGEDGERSYSVKA